MAQRTQGQDSKVLGITRDFDRRRLLRALLLGGAGIGGALLLTPQPVLGGPPVDDYYVLTKLDASLVNSRLHPNSGNPNYNATHNFTDLAGTALAAQLPSDVAYTDVAQSFTAVKTFAVDILFDADNLRSIGTASTRAKDLNIGGLALFGTSGNALSFMIRADGTDVATPHLRPDSSGNLVINPGVGANIVLAKTRGFLIEIGRTLYPDTHNAFDVGSSVSQAFRNGFFAGQLKARSKNVIVVENLDDTQTSATVPSVDTDLKTYVLPANSYTHVIVEAEGYIAFTTLSTNQDINLKIKDGSAQVGQTMKVDAALSATSKIPFTVKASFVDTVGATLHITHGAAAADANTTVFLNSLRVYGES